MTTIEKIEKGIITLAEFTEDQQSFIRGLVKLSFNEGQEQASEKDYEILSLTSIESPTKKEKVVWYFDKENNGWTVDEPERAYYKDIPDFTSIHSIKRLSDGEVFTVGDKFKALTGSKEIEEIQSFEILHGVVRARMYHTQTKGSAIRLILEDPYIERYKTPLFTTEDGVDIYEGDKYYCINANLQEKVQEIFATKSTIKSCFYRYFSTKEKAEEYILMHKPCLSVKDILKRFNSRWSEVTETTLKELVKSKL